MDSAELERNIGELEEKLDRLRALYEQYFSGIEKLEPQVPRKDVERRIVIIRKEQIRNTALRFKFNTVVQRYNTMQQHWNRILREIETGTYKRDLVRAAARFGVEDALTAVGRKRAQSMAAGLQAQVDRQARKQQRKGAEAKADEYEEVADVDVEADEDFDDDAPTPPPIVPGAHAAPELAQAAVGHPHAAYPHASQPQAQHPHGGHPQAGYPQAGYPQAAPYVYGQPEQVRQAQQPQVQQHQQPWAPRASDPEIDVRPATWPPQAPSSAPSAMPKKAGGLRLGGGPSKRASAEALNRIASSLGDPAAPAAPSARKPLLSSPLGMDLPLVEPQLTPQAPPVASAAASNERVAPRARPIEPTTARLAPPPRPVDPAATPAPGAAAALRPPQRAGVPSSPGGGVRPGLTGQQPPAGQAAIAAAKGLTSNEPAPAAAASASDASGASATPAPANAAARAAQQRDASAAGTAARAKGAKGEDLSEPRLREIYSQYVNSRRERNESTAGITFEKLADSLRSQADKLRTKHASKRVDYEIVVKDGKTLIKPIVR